MIRLLKSDIPIQRYVHLKFPLWKVQNWEIVLQSYGFEGIFEHILDIRVGPIKDHNSAKNSKLGKKKTLQLLTLHVMMDHFFMSYW